VILRAMGPPFARHRMRIIAGNWPCMMGPMFTTLHPFLSRSASEDGACEEGGCEAREGKGLVDTTPLGRCQVLRRQEQKNKKTKHTARVGRLSPDVNSQLDEPGGGFMGMRGGFMGMNGGVHGHEGGVHGHEGGVHGHEGGGFMGMKGGVHGHEGGVHGHEGGVHGHEGGGSWA